MPRITSDKILLEINLVNNNFLELEPAQNDYCNWVPFSLTLSIDGKENYSYQPEKGATFSLYEIKNLISNLERIISLKQTSPPDANSSSFIPEAVFTPYTFSSCECYFEMVIYDALENNAITIDFWFNMGTLTGGQIYGYSRGFRFATELDTLTHFVAELKTQFEEIVSVDFRQASRASGQKAR